MDQRTFQAFVDGVSLASDEHGFAIAANALAEALGYRWFAYISLGQGRPELLSTYPAFWTDHYFASGFDAVDPVLSVSSQHVEPFCWGVDEGVRPTDPAGIRLFDDSASFGIRRGITIPLRGPRERIGAFTLATDEPQRGPQHQCSALLDAIQACGLQFHAHASSRIIRFASEKRARQLTERQRACLAATADGRSAKQTARIVELTPRTVQHHLEAAKRRLEAESLPQAVAVAIREALIT